MSGRKATPSELVQNTVWSIEGLAHRVQTAPDEPSMRKRLRSLRRAVDELEQRAMVALSPDPGATDGGGR